MTAYCRTDSGPRFYVLGGRRSPSDTVERICLEYAPATNVWRQRSPMRYRREMGQACAVRGRVYVLGGYETFGNPLNIVEVFDPMLNSWSVGPSMPESAAEFGTGVWRDSLIFVFGGGTWHPSAPPGDAVWYFDPSGNSWHTATGLPGPLGAMVAGISGDTVLVAAGWNDSGPTNLAWQGRVNPANPSEITWSILDTLPAPRRCRAAGGVAGNQLLVVGGLGISGAPCYRDSASGVMSAGLSVLADAWSRQGAGPWQPLPAKPLPVSDVFGSACDSATLLVPGGYSGSLPFLSANEALCLAASTHDVGVADIMSPSGRLKADSAYPVEAVIENLGSSDETFPCNAAVFDSSARQILFSRDTLLDLAAGMSARVDFGMLTPPGRSVLVTTVVVNLPGDENPANDTLRCRSRTTTGSDPDGFGYVFETTQEPDTIGFSWYSPGHDQITDWDPNPDDGTSRRRLPFEFPYYGDSTDRVYICTNGYLQSSDNTTSQNFPLPFEGITDCLAPFWDDLDLRERGAVYESLTSSRAIYTWVDVPRNGDDSSLLTFQVVLEHNGRVRYNYLRVSGDRSSSTVGIQGKDGTWGWYQEYVYGGQPPAHVPADSTSILFYCPPAGTAEPVKAAHRPTPALILSPNPCHRSAGLRLTVDGPDRPALLRILDAAGRVVMSPPVVASPLVLRVSGLPAGIYFVRATFTAGSLTRQLLVLD